MAHTRRVSYAMATGAVIVALGGGAFALAATPGQGKVLHGCVSRKTGLLRVVKSASSCRKHRELAINWNKQGQRGLRGIAGARGPQGAQGAKGDQGPQGPGATTFAATLAQGTTNGMLTHTRDGIVIEGNCVLLPAQAVVLTLAANGHTIQLSGTENTGASTSPARADGITSMSTSNPTDVELDVIARDTTIGRFDRIDVHGSFGSPCKYWGMATPSG
jgi:hypothetical protein